MSIRVRTSATRRTICDLRPKEARGYEKSDIIPNCEQHAHLTRDEAEHLVNSGVADYLGANECRILRHSKRYWMPKNSGGASVLELVVPRQSRRRE